ncbi:MAG: DUF3597 domain-containing protein [Erythrobacter sp.]|uniref:DUF3597 domain-containing protein n=1 Tax=Erythrobacter sp. TaxID=1042 RepID=UPI0032EADF27
MGIFSSIKDAIWGEDEADDADKAEKPAPAPAAKPAAPAAPEPMSEVDVAFKLDSIDGSDSLNWRTSIVDLMKLIGLDASYANRKELAEEMGMTDYSGEAEENIALHRHVMTRLAEAGGRVPADLRD